MISKIVEDGYHFLSGVSRVKVQLNNNDEEVDGILLTIDDENYLCYEDPCDGYRSYGIAYKTDMVQTNAFPKQEVFIRNSKVICSEYGYNSADKEFMVIRNDYTDTYYPIAIFEYHPENLPINKGRIRRKYEN